MPSQGQAGIHATSMLSVESALGHSTIHTGASGLVSLHRQSLLMRRTSTSFGLHTLWVACMLQSFLLLPSTANLRLRTLPWRHKHVNRNASLRAARRILRGAPCIWAFAFIPCWLPKAQAMRHSNHEGDRHDVPAETVGQPTEVHQEHSQGLWGSALSEGLAFRIPSIVLRYQRSHMSNMQWWNQGITSCLWCAMVRDDYFGQMSRSKFLLPSLSRLLIGWS